MKKDTHKFINSFFKVLRTLSITCGLNLYRNGNITLNSNDKVLLKANKNMLSTVINKFSNRVFDKPSSLIDEDEFLNQDILVKMLESLKKTGNILITGRVNFSLRNGKVIIE